MYHGAYAVDYDLLPNTPNQDLLKAFKGMLTPEINQVWFGHYHYQIDRVIDGIEFHCIRPVGHHRDKDTRASYSLYENGKLTHKRVKYNLTQTVEDFKKSDSFTDMELKEKFIVFLENAYHEELLKKDLRQMDINKEKASRH